MTQQKKRKQAIRSRARKTGESYTAARRQVLLAREKGRAERKAVTARPSSTPPRTTPAKSAPGIGPGVSDKSVLAKTGHGLDHWFAVLDAFDVRAKGHNAGAEHLYEAHRINAWHAEMITVAYERARGLRTVNQACDGSFQVSVSRALAVPVARVAAAISDPQQRSRWLEGADPDLRAALDQALDGPAAKAVKIKDALNARLRYKWGAGVVEIRITGKAKGPGSSIVADNSDLPQPSLVETRRAQWKAALDALKEHLGN